MLPPKSMKAMKAAAAAGPKPVTASAVYKQLAESTGVKTKQVKGTVEAYLSVAATQLKKAGVFKVWGVLKLKLESKPATAARKGVNPFTKEPCVFKAKPASRTVRALPLKKFKVMLN